MTTRTAGSYCTRATKKRSNKRNNIASDSGHSETDLISDSSENESKEKQENSMLYVATRLCIGKEEVKIITVDQIKHFDAHKNTFPYNAYVENGLDSDDEIIYEPATILALAQTKSELENRKKKWPKPKKRRSDIIHELANNASSNTDKLIKSSIKISTSKKEEPVITKEEQEETDKKIAILTKKPLNFDTRYNTEVEVTDEKDNIIAKLKKELEEERKKNQEKAGIKTFPGKDLIPDVTTFPVLFSKRKSAAVSKEPSTSVARSLANPEESATPSHTCQRNSSKRKSAAVSKESSTPVSSLLASPVESPSLIFSINSLKRKSPVRQNPLT